MSANLQSIQCCNASVEKTVVGLALSIGAMVRESKNGELLPATHACLADILIYEDDRHSVDILHHACRMKTAADVP